MCIEKRKRLNKVSIIIIIIIVIVIVIVIIIIIIIIFIIIIIIIIITILFQLEKTFTNGEYQQHLNALSVCHRNRFFTSWLVARPI